MTASAYRVAALSAMSEWLVWADRYQVARAKMPVSIDPAVIVLDFPAPSSVCAGMTTQSDTQALFAGITIRWENAAGLAAEGQNGTLSRSVQLGLVHRIRLELTAAWQICERVGGGMRASD